MTRTQLTADELFDIEMLLLKEDHFLEEQKLVFEEMGLGNTVEAQESRIKRNDELLKKIREMREEWVGKTKR
jgi:hypothetical protein